MIDLKPLPPKEAIGFFRSKGLKPSFAWQDVWQEEHAKAFTVAKMMDVALLEDTRAIVDLSISEGWTLDQFKKELAPRLKAAGWWGKQLMGDPETGEVKLVQLGSARRLRTIFEVNMRSSYAAGKWQRIQRTKTALPYLMYDAIDDGKTRAPHRAMDGFCAEVDDPVWDKWYPPCGWRCRCNVISMTRAQFRAVPAENLKKPNFPMKRYVNPRTGEVTELEEGIDPGFNFNIGKAPLRPLTARPAPPPYGVMKGPPADRRDAVAGFLEKVGAQDKPRVVQDRDGWPVVMSKDLFTDAAGDASVPRPDLLDKLGLVGEALTKPERAEWLWSDDDAALKGVVRRFADDAWNNRGSADGEAFLGRAPGWLAKLAQKHGLRLEGFGHVMPVHRVRHIRNEHGDPVREGKRGQIAVTSADLVDLVDILERPDAVVFGLEGDKDQKRIGFVKRFAGYVADYIVNIHKGQHQLTPVSFRKLPRATDVMGQARHLDLNGRTGTGSGDRIVDLQGKINPPMANLIRRYTRRLDKRVVTVDFAGGSWTYDVRDLD